MSLIDLLSLAKPEQGRVIMSSFEERYRTWHARLSYVKSAIRLAATGAAAWFHSDTAVAILLLAIGLFIAELVGILEEII